MQLYYAFKSIQSFVPLLLMLCLSTGVIAQGKAGEDKMICQGGSTTIGTNLTICSGCCVKWTPTTGLSDPKSPNPTVENLSASTEYSMAIVNADGDIVENDKVIVYVCKLDLNLYKPKFVDGMEHQVPKGQEESLGAQTFVNLDSDDNDDFFDILGDEIIAGGDNEFIRLEFTLELINPGNLPTPEDNHVKVLGYPNPDIDTHIKIWKSETKEDGELYLGEDLTLKKNTNSTYSNSVWIEGVSPHNTQRESKIYGKLKEGSSENTICNTNMASMTVIGISELKWVGNKNGYTGDGKNNSNTLDLKSTENGYLDHVRVFPEKKYTQIGVDLNYSDKTYLNVILSVQPIEEIPIYIRFFDADDPSNSQQFIDLNDDLASNSGDYPGNAGLSWDSENDNRGSVNGFKFGNVILKPKLTQVITSSINSGLGIFKYYISENNFSLEFKISHFPGDNYQVALFCDLEFLKNLRNTDKFDKEKIVFKSSSCSDHCPEIYSPLKSLVLTCWRTLHIENDMMVNPSWSENLKINGFFMDFQSTTNLLSQTYKVKLINVTPPYTGIADSNKPLKDNSSGNGRFSNGGVRLGNQLLSICTQTSNQLLKNGEDFIEFSSPKNLTMDQTSSIRLICELKNSNVVPTVSKSFSILEISREPSSPTFTVTIANPTNASIQIYNHQNVSIGGGDFSNNCVITTPDDNTHFKIKTTLDGKSNLKIPIEIIDDDNIPLVPPNSKSTLIQPLTLSIARSKFDQVYIDLNIDGGGNINNNQNDLPFYRNVSATNNELTIESPYSQTSLEELSKKNFNTDKLGEEGYWIIYVVSVHLVPTIV